MTEIKMFTTYFVNCYIVRGEKTIMFDTGTLFTPEQLPGVLEELGVAPDEIDIIVVSHAHFDHAELAKAWKELTGAKILCHRAAVEFLSTGKKEPRFDFGPKALACQPYVDYMMENSPELIPTVEPEIIVGNDDFDMHPYGIPGKIVYTPGHDDSCIALVLDDRTAIVGDTIYDLHTIPPIADEYPEGSISLNWMCTDEELIKQSATKLLELADTFYCGHAAGPVSRTVLESLVK